MRQRTHATETIDWGMDGRGVLGLDVHPALVAKIGELTCAIPVEHVVEILRPLPVEPPAAATPRAPYVAGIAIIRGVATTVIDTARLLALGSHTVTRFVVLRSPGRKTALTFEGVSGVHPVALGELRPLRDLLPAAFPDVGDALTAVIAATRVMP